MVGEKIDITASLNFADTEEAFLGEDKVTMVVAGPQALNVPLPTSAGAFTQADITTFPKYSSDPDGTGPLASGDTVGTLSGTVTLNKFKFP